MSFPEILAKIPRWTPAQRGQVMRRLRELDAASNSQANEEGFQCRHVQGRVLLKAPRIIRQDEVDAILEEFP